MMSEEITISEETLKMLISMAHQEGYKLAHQTLSDLNVDTLSNKATLIPKINLKMIKNVIGNDTVSAVRSGFFWGYAGLIDNIIKLIKKETRKSFKVIITGGFSNLFKKSINTKVYHNKYITINGLIKISKLIK